MRQPPPKPDYSAARCWAALEPKPQAAFDVFYLYPTFFRGAPGALMDVYTTRATPFIQNNIRKNTGIFGGAGGLYAPLYRQASFAALALPEAQKAAVLQISLEDVRAAFYRYLKHYNNGRPFVLAGHSQGSRLLRELIKADFADGSLSAGLIAAYLLGAEVTAQDCKKYPWLKPARSANDTGVIITYNCQAQGVQNSPIYERGGAVCVNPLNWGAQPAGRELNLGAVFFDKTANPAREEARFTGAYIENGALITPDVNAQVYSAPLFPGGVYHLYDYEFFYRNLQSNFKDRLKAFKSR
ncbi:MAG: DUF3089 domain-containing protein [Elusimicrobiota bacterium]|jgi:hypothetical protein|nr:DUF3089 domain-containing protein [Elusimicrobiota bacterium]